MNSSMYLLGEISHEHDDEKINKENAVFFVNYNEWRDVNEIDLEQNYFAIDDPYEDEDFRLLHLQNGIKDITPAGVHYGAYEEAAQALYEKEREIANLPHNKDNNIGSFMVNGRAQLERILEARHLQKHMDMVNDKVSYYVIEDLSTWAENSPNRSDLERFDSFTEALEKFKAYREKDVQFNDDKARTTLGFNVHGSEFDVIHARNNENVLSLDFTYSSEAKQSNRFMDDLQILCNELVDRVRVHRDMSPEEVKAFVKERFRFKLERSGHEDISMYMSRFDTLYEQGKMDHLMPTASQKHIVEDIPLERWDNPYFSLNEPDQMAFSVRDKFVSIQTCTEGYDYSIYHADYRLLDGGVYDNPNISIHAALRYILGIIGAKRSDLVPVEYDELTKKAEAVGMANIGEKNTRVTLTVAECGEFHELGEYHEGIASVDEALAIFHRIPPERMNGIPSIGINVHTEGTESYQDTTIDLISGEVADLEVLDYVLDISTNPKAIDLIAELINKFPGIEIRGSLEKWKETIS